MRLLSATLAFLLALSVLAEPSPAPSNTPAPSLVNHVLPGSPITVSTTAFNPALTNAGGTTNSAGTFFVSSLGTSSSYSFQGASQTSSFVVSPINTPDPSASQTGGQDVVTVTALRPSPSQDPVQTSGFGSSGSTESMFGTSDASDSAPTSTGTGGFQLAQSQTNAGYRAATGQLGFAVGLALTAIGMGAGFVVVL